MHQMLETRRDSRQATQETQQRITLVRLTNGPAAAAILATGIGSLMLGLLTIVSAAPGWIHTILTFYPPSGVLSGQTTIAVLAWLVAWGILAWRWQHRQVKFTRVFMVTLLLIGLGLVGTFPPFYHLF